MPREAGAAMSWHASLKKSAEPGPTKARSRLKIRFCLGSSNRNGCGAGSMLINGNYISHATLPSCPLAQEFIFTRLRELQMMLHRVVDCLAIAAPFCRSYFSCEALTGFSCWGWLACDVGSCAACDWLVLYRTRLL